MPRAWHPHAYRRVHVAWLSSNNWVAAMHSEQLNQGKDSINSLRRPIIRSAGDHRRAPRVHDDTGEVRAAKLLGSSSIRSCNGRMHTKTPSKNVKLSESGIS